MSCQSKRDSLDRSCLGCAANCSKCRGGDREVEKSVRGIQMNHGQEVNIKEAFNETYDTLEDLLSYIEANPKMYESSTGQHLVSVSNSVIEFWKKLRKEP